MSTRNPSSQDVQLGSRVALVTGAARGIGAATVRELCQRGYQVAALDSCAGGDVPPGVGYPLATPRDLAELASEWPEQVLPVEADVRDPEALESAVNRTLVAFGRLDAVVASAGVVIGGAVQWQTPSSHLNTLWEINLGGVWNTAQATLPTLLAAPEPRSGRFVAISSAAGERGRTKMSAYSASKHAIVGLVRGIAADLVGTGVAAMAVSPGSTRTAMLASTADLYDATIEHLAQQLALGRLIEPAEIAAAVAMCCSPAGAILNGSVLRADGGVTR